MVGRWWYRIKRRPFVVAAVIAGLVVLVLALYVMPAVLVVPDDKLTVADRLKAENDIRTTLLQALAGATLLVGLYFTGRTFQLNREGQVTERFTRAIDQLGSDKLDVRLGGISRSSDSHTHRGSIIRRSWRCSRPSYGNMHVGRVPPERCRALIR